MVASAVPSGIICLLSALRIHGIGTQAPHEVWLALDRKARKPARLPARVRIVRFSGAMLTYGIQTRLDPRCPGARSPRLPARSSTAFATGQARSRRRPRGATRSGPLRASATVDEIMRAAEVCHARTVMKPYLEALAP